MSFTPVIRDTQGDFSMPCEPAGGLKELHRIHRTLPPWLLHNNDPDVLQDEDGNPILDETTDNFIYDTLREGGAFQS